MRICYVLDGGVCESINLGIQAFVLVFTITMVFAVYQIQNSGLHDTVRPRGEDNKTFNLIMEDVLDDKSTNRGIMDVDMEKATLKEIESTLIDGFRL